MLMQTIPSSYILKAPICFANGESGGHDDEDDPDEDEEEIIEEES